MIVELKNYRFYKKNALNYVIEEKDSKVNNLTGKPSESWKFKGYVSNIEQCVNHLLKLDLTSGKLEDDEKISMKEYIEVLNTCLLEVTEDIKDKTEDFIEACLDKPVLIEEEMDELEEEE